MENKHLSYNDILIKNGLLSGKKEFFDIPSRKIINKILSKNIKADYSYLLLTQKPISKYFINFIAYKEVGKFYKIGTTFKLHTKIVILLSPLLILFYGVKNGFKEIKKTYQYFKHKNVIMKDLISEEDFKKISE